MQDTTQRLCYTILPGHEHTPSVQDSWHVMVPFDDEVRSIYYIPAVHLQENQHTVAASSDTATGSHRVNHKKTTTNNNNAQPVRQASSKRAIFGDSGGGDLDLMTSPSYWPMRYVLMISATIYPQMPRTRPSVFSSVSSCVTVLWGWSLLGHRNRD